MEFISNILKVTKDIRVIFYFNFFNTSKKYYEELINLLEDEDINFAKKTPWEFILNNDNKVLLFKKDEHDLNLCGQRANIVITDIDKKDKNFYYLIVPLITCPSLTIINGTPIPDTKFCNFIYNPVIKKIF
jgi:hypothetical protein